MHKNHRGAGKGDQEEKKLFLLGRQEAAELESFTGTEFSFKK